jgi:hypothetical protein
LGLPWTTTAEGENLQIHRELSVKTMRYQSHEIWQTLNRQTPKTECTAYSRMEVQLQVLKDLPPKRQGFCGPNLSHYSLRCQKHCSVTNQPRTNPVT